MPHAVEVWDRSDSDSDTNPPLTIAQLGLASDSDSDSNDERPNTRVGTAKKNQPRSRKQRTLPARGYLFEDKVDTDDIIDPKDMGLQVLQARRKGHMEKFKACAPIQLVTTAGAVFTIAS